MLLKTLLERFDAARVEPFCGKKTLMTAETTATNEPTLIPEPLLQPPVNTNLPSTTSKIPPLIKMNPATSSPSKTFLTSTVRTTVNKIPPSKIPIPLPHSAITMPQTTATTSSRGCRRRPLSIAVSGGGSKLKQSLPERVSDTPADAVIPDGTKCHSQDDDRSFHSVQATLGEDTAEESRSLLDLSVNADWNETAADLNAIDAVTDDATVVSDADEGIMTAFTDENRDHQLDLVHVGRTLDYNLWDDGVFSLDQRTEIVSEVIDEVFHLKNSVEPVIETIS